MKMILKIKKISHIPLVALLLSTHEGNAAARAAAADAQGQEGAGSAAAASVSSGRDEFLQRWAPPAPPIDKEISLPEPEDAFKVIHDHLRQKYRISTQEPTEVNSKTHMVLQSAVDGEYIVVDRVLITRYSGLIQSVTKDQSEGDLINITLGATDSTNDKLSSIAFTTKIIIEFLEWIEALDKSSTLKPVDVDMIRFANYLNLLPVQPRLHNEDAKQTFFKQAGNFLLAHSPQDMNKLTVVNYADIIDSDPSLKARLLNQFPTNETLLDCVENYRKLNLNDIRHITVPIGIPNLSVIATEAEVRALTANDTVVNQFFTNNANAALVVDFGDATMIGDGFGYDAVNYRSTIPTSIRHMIIQGDHLTSVGNWFLRACTGLTSLTLPHSFRSVGDGFLAGCTGLTSLDLSNTQITSVGHGFLSRCTGLTSLNLPNSLKSVGYGFLANCTGLTSLDLSNTQITSVGYGFLANCTGLTSLTLPNTLTSVGDYFLDGCTGLTSLTLPHSFTSVGGFFLYGCTGLTSLTLPHSLTSVGNWFLSRCTGLTSLNLPHSFTSVGDGFLSHCTGLTSLDLSNTQITTVGDGFLSHCTGLTSLSLPNTLTSVGISFLYGCTGLTQGSVIVNDGSQTAYFFNGGMYKPSKYENPNYVQNLIRYVD